VTKGNLIDNVLSTGFVSVWALILRGSNIQIQKIVISCFLFLVFDIIIALIAKRMMQGKKKYKATWHDARRILFSISFLLMLMISSFVHTRTGVFIVIILYTESLLIASTLARAGLKIDVSHSLLTGKFFKN
jgi:hypothetical protein